MSDRTSLTELTQFVGKSSLSTDDLQFRRALNQMTRALNPKPAHRTVGDLLGVVLTLSARTRRSAMPQVNIELDVFAPGGRRAARIIQPHHRR